MLPTGELHNVQRLDPPAAQHWCTDVTMLPTGELHNVQRLDPSVKRARAGG
jgi:hypothetical protein